MTKDEALRMALEALQDPLAPTKRMKAITAIKEALAQPEQEPVAWLDPESKQVCPEIGFEYTITTEHPRDLGWIPLAPMQPQRKPLTDEMKKQCPYTAYPSQQAAFMEGWLKAEAAHGIKE